MNKLLAGALFAAAATTTACGSFSQSAQESNPAPCPNVLVLDDAARALEFEGEESLDNITYTAEITGVSLGCRYVEDQPIDVDLTVDMAFGKGPKGAEGEKIFKYFVAVTRRDREVISKKEFGVVADFESGENLVFAEEEIDRIIIERKDDSVSGENFEIVVGIAVTPQQAIYNRSGKSLKFPEL